MRPGIRRIRSGEGLRLKDLRLRALSEAPLAFGSTYAAEVNYSDEVWGQRADGASVGCERATFIAERDDQWVGLVTGMMRQDEAEGRSTLLISMFVDRAVRGLGVGDALVGHVRDWADDCGSSELTLWVTEGNDPAIALYRRSGFRMTGAKRAHVHTPTSSECEMVHDPRSPPP